MFFKLNTFISKQTIFNILLFCLLFLFPTQLGKHFWPNFAFINSLRIDYFSPTLYFWDLVLIFVFLFCLFLLKKINKFPVLVFFIFLISQLSSLLYQENIGPGLVRVKDYLTAGLFGILVSSLTLKKEYLVLFWGLVAGVFFESLLAILQFINNGSLGLWVFGERDFTSSTISIATFNWYGEVFLRPYATFSHPNVLAAYLILSLSLIYLFYKKYKIKSNKIFALVGLLGLVAAFLTFSRGALIFLALQVAYLLKNKVKWLLVIGFFLIPFLFVRYYSALNFDYLSITRREQLADVAISQFIEYPLLGVGLNNFINESSGLLIAGPSRFLQPVHNIYLLILTETGIIGFAGFLALVSLPIYKLIKSINKTEVKILLFCWLMVLSLGLLDHYFLTLPQGQRLLFLVWGLSFLRNNTV